MWRHNERPWEQDLNSNEEQDLVKAVYFEKRPTSHYIHKKKVTKKLTRTGDNRDVAQQAKDLRAKEGAVPDIEELVEKNLRAGKTLLMETGDMFN